MNDRFFNVGHRATRVAIAGAAASAATSASAVVVISFMGLASPVSAGLRGREMTAAP